MRRQSRKTFYCFCIFLILGIVYIISTHRTSRIAYSANPDLAEDYKVTSADSWFFFNQQQNRSPNNAISPKALKSQRSFNIIRLITKCQDRGKELSIRERGDFLVFYNMIPARRDYLCHESITLATQGDYTFLDNLLRLVVRWQGPVSVSLYAPGDDFNATMESIAFLRQCQNYMIKDYVTFHLFYNRKDYPKTPGTRIFDLISTYDEPIDCDSYTEPPYYNIKRPDMYKTKHKLTYPINVARNIAIQEAQTHYVLASDMELIPSAGIIDNFLAMIANKYEGMDASDLQNFNLNDNVNEVYAIALMEVTVDSKVPATKSQLIAMHGEHKAFFFAEKVCISCQGIPDRKKWINNTETEGLHIFTTAKRKGSYERWEPVYIGTRTEPLFDERVTWEGTTNKMIQAFTMCLLDYDFHILDNAFFVHRPGIKKKSSQISKDKKEMAKLITKTIVPELLSIYGKRKGCVVGGQLTRKAGG